MESVAPGSPSETGRRLRIVALQLINLRRGSVDTCSWIPPFDSEAGYENTHWWNSARGTTGEPVFVQVLEAGVEVARVLLDDPGGIDPLYTDLPELGDERLEIQLIEVAVVTRGRRIGTRVVDALAESYPERRLFAYSVNADNFWASLAGWERFNHPNGRSSPLFIRSIQ